jgi:hypothetical protein
MTSCPRQRHSGAPQRRLADPGRSLQDQGRGSPRHRPDEGLYLGEFGVPPEVTVNRLFHPTPPAAALRSYGRVANMTRATTLESPGRGR